MMPSIGMPLTWLRWWILLFVNLSCVCAEAKALATTADPYSVLAAALQSGDIQYWRNVLGTIPPNSEWLATLRASPIYWLLSPMSWFWLSLIWLALAEWNEAWRLTKLSRIGLLSLILVLPIGWLFYWNLWAGLVASLVLLGLVILLAARCSSSDDNWQMVADGGTSGVSRRLTSGHRSIDRSISARASPTVLVFERPQPPKGEPSIIPGVILVALMIGLVIGAGIGSIFGGLIGAVVGFMLGDAINRKIGGEWSQIRRDGDFLLMAGLVIGALTGWGTFGWLGTHISEDLGACLMGIGVCALMLAGALMSADRAVGSVAAGVVGIGVVAGVLRHYQITAALDAVILIGTIGLAALLLGFACVFLTGSYMPWLMARRQTMHWLCRSDSHRARLGRGLSWAVRWSGRLLIEEVPRQHESFADYFVCRCCGKRDFVTAECLVGIIGSVPVGGADGELTLPMFDPATRQARTADIDRLDIYPPPPGDTVDYDYAVNAVLNALSEDHHRTRRLKCIPVRIHGGLTLPENTRRMLADRFGRVTAVP